jgi:hypothetical protein
MPDIDRALLDRRMLGAGFADISTWRTWLVILKAAFGLRLSEEERATFTAVAGNRAVPTQRVRELWCIAGRRSGKSRIAAAIAIYLALFVRHKLSAGERGMILVLAATTEQARVVFEYAKAFLDSAPALQREIESFTRSEIRLRNGIIVGIHANSFRSIRGRTLCACIFDEVAVWRSEESAQPDIETYRSVLPTLLTTKGMLVGISTGYRRVGLLFQKHRDHFGQDDANNLIVQGSTQQFNGTVDEAEIAAQVAADPAAARSEWFGQFRDDLSTYLADDLIDAAIEPGRPLELPPQEGVRYSAFTDAAAGVGRDAYTIAIGHRQGENFVVDVTRGTVGKFDPQEATRQYAALCREYRIRSLVGDNYASQWVAGAWREVDIEYTRSALPKSQIYLEVLPLFARHVVRLPDHWRLIRELRLLERSTRGGGRDLVDHAKGGHDDHANVCCGVLNLLRMMAVDDFVIPRIPEMTRSNNSEIPAHYLKPANDLWRPYRGLPDSIRTPIPSWLR